MKMNEKKIIGLIFGGFVILLIASTGAFSDIIRGFTSAMGLYGFIFGVLIVLIIIFGVFSRLRGKK